MKNIIVSLLTFAACIVMFTSCEKNQLRVAEFELVEGKSQLKVNLALPFTRNPGMQIKVNDRRVSSTLFNSSTNYSNPYPGGGLNTLGNSFADFLTVDPGNAKVSLSFPKAGTNEDSVEIHTTNVTLETDKFYTLHIADTGSNTQSVLTVEDRTAPDSGFTRYTFINLIPNIPAVDLYFGTTLIAGNIPYKGSSPAFTLASPTTNAWAIRPAGAAASTTAIATYATGTVPDRRVMTVFTRGYGGITSTTDIRRPQISLFYVR